ncbi:MAG: class I SAM-dependent methyltransferase [Gallionella sp.]|jgi:2-polyprenyl-3-methyl-5-hydroxy-6-metoxy-1,4-benzoquinol methylase|nr:class I SAM-dependent methyltransferase [Gallionella sp.]MCK9352992.1 class I SAM-dependent methyltransferase [Gallionella sp.]
MSIWNERYAGEHYHFGTEPNAFLVSQRHLLKPGMSCLAVADGEGRNGVWLAEQGLEVLSVDSSPVALEKAKRLAAERGAKLDFELADLLNWEWRESRYDVVAAIFIQFVGPELRAQMLGHIQCSLKPGGLLLLQGYTPRQLEYRTGGPSQVENLYTEDMLREAFADMEVLHLAEHDSFISEGSGHHGMSALIDLVARKPQLNDS